MKGKPLNFGGITPLFSVDEIKGLLVGCGLPVSDIALSHHARFFGIHLGSKLVAAVGIELYRSVGLLRSLAVAPSCRGFGLGHQLVAYAERVAVSESVGALYLLTTTASKFFEKLDFVSISRAEAPSAIRLTSQFAGLCPSSSAFLRKSVSEGYVSFRSENTSNQMSEHKLLSFSNANLEENNMDGLNPRELELVALGAAMGSNCAPCIEYHIREAKKVGLNEHEILAAIQFADKVRQVPASKVLQTALKLLPSAADNFQLDNAAADCGCASGNKTEKNEAGAPIQPHDMMGMMSKMMDACSSHIQAASSPDSEAKPAMGKGCGCG